MPTKLDRLVGLLPLKEKKTILGKATRAVRNGILFMAPGMFVVWGVKNAVNEIITREKNATPPKHFLDYKAISGLGIVPKTIGAVRNTITSPIWATKMLTKGLVSEVLNSGKNALSKVKKLRPKKIIERHREKKEERQKKRAEKKQLKLENPNSKKRIKLRLKKKRSNPQMDNNSQDLADAA